MSELWRPDCEMARRNSRSRTFNTPPASSPAARRRMQATRRAGTQAEIELARELDRLGFLYRTDAQVIASLRRRADFVFETEHLAVFVDGCFWHSCPRHSTHPKSNGEWWAEKLRANRRRDLDTNRQLRRAGWKVLRIWEHEKPEKGATRVARALRSSPHAGAEYEIAGNEMIRRARNADAQAR